MDYTHLIIRKFVDNGQISWFCIRIVKEIHEKKSLDFRGVNPDCMLKYYLLMEKLVLNKLE